MRAPAEFRRLQPFRHEAFHRPGVDEDVDRLLGGGALGVAFGDVNAFYADLVHQELPVIALFRHVVLDVYILGKVEQSLFDEPGHHAGISAATGHRRRAAGVPVAGVQDDLAQGVVGARLRPGVLSK